MRVALVWCLVLFWCGNTLAAEMPPTPVSVAKAITKNVPVTLKGTGHVEALSTISMKSRIDGRLEKIFIDDGAMVKNGEQIFEIDTVPYTLDVKKAEADLKREIANAKITAELAKTSMKLLSDAIISKDKYDQDQAAADEAAAAVGVAKSNLNIAKQNLEYCKITSPINGMAGRKLLDQGSLISAYQDVLIVINDIDNIKVLFSLPAKNLKELRKYQMKGELSVSIVNPENPENILTGRIKYIGNEINSSTGMFEVQGEFDNKEQLFWPGEYVRATVTLTIRKDAVLVPHRALVNSEGQSEIVYVINNNKAESRPIKVGWRVGEEVVIVDGIKEGEEVVIDGQFKLYPEAKVKIIPESKSK